MVVLNDQYFKHFILFLERELNTPVTLVGTGPEVLELIDTKPENVELVLTGRNVDEKIIERADLVTEMREIKHYYQNGIHARKGIES